MSNNGYRQTQVRLSGDGFKKTRFKNFLLRKNKPQLVGVVKPLTLDLAAQS